MSGGFSVDTDALIAHAAALAGLADRLRSAANAGQPLGVDAYGVIGQFFAGSAMQAAARSAVAVEHLSGAMATIRTGVRLTASEYRRVDAEIALVLAGVE